MEEQEKAIVSHRYAELSTGITMHFVETEPGTKEMPPVILVHGWPEFWYSWRHQIVALSKAGYRVIAVDQRGFNETSAPKDKHQYGLEYLTSDLVALLDYLKLPNAIFIGHDWGSAVVWALSLHHPQRVYAVGSLVIPFLPPNVDKNPFEAMKKDPGRFDYMLYFQEEGVAEKEFEKNIEYTFKCLMRSSKPEDKIKTTQKVDTSNVRARSGMLVGFPHDNELKRSMMFGAEDMKEYVKAFSRSGFRGTLNFYRNIEENWKFSKKVAGKKIMQPALMVTVGRDPVAPPISARHMKDWIPNLTVQHIEESGHWVQQEEPQKLNHILTDWLQSLYINKDTLLRPKM